MPYFSLHRDHVLRTTKGLSVRFKKGESVWVPPALTHDAVSIGAVPVDEAVDVIDSGAPEQVILSPEQRKDKIREAIRVMLQRNERNDFTANGYPDARRMKALTGFDVDTRERDDVWLQYQQELVDDVG